MILDGPKKHGIIEDVIVDVPASNETSIKASSVEDNSQMPSILDEGMYESVNSYGSSEGSDTKKPGALKQPMPPAGQHLTIPVQHPSHVNVDEKPRTGPRHPSPKYITPTDSINKYANKPPNIETDLVSVVRVPFRGRSLFDFPAATSSSKSAAARNLAMWVDVNANISPTVREEAEKWGARSNPARSDPARMRRSARMYERLSHASSMDPGKSIISAELDERTLAMSQAEPRNIWVLGGGVVVV